MDIVNFKAFLLNQGVVFVFECIKKPHFLDVAAACSDRLAEAIFSSRTDRVGTVAAFI